MHTTKGSSVLYQRHAENLIRPVKNTHGKKVFVVQILDILRNDTETRERYTYF